LLYEWTKIIPQRNSYSSSGYWDHVCIWDKGPFSTLPLIVLVNSDTASAAEIVTAALQQNNRAKVIGEKTFGKGVSGSFFELGDGSAMDLTIAKWFTPKGDWVGGTGITPDVSIEDDLKNGEDTILKKALML